MGAKRSIRPDWNAERTAAFGIAQNKASMTAMGAYRTLTPPLEFRFRHRIEFQSHRARWGRPPLRSNAEPARANAGEAGKEVTQQVRILLAELARPAGLEPPAGGRRQRDGSAGPNPDGANC
jgi:hypothetical protein